MKITTTTIIKVSLLCTILIISSASELFAQTGSIAGRVLTAKRGDLLTGVTVSIDGTNKRTITDVEGKFIFNNVSTGRYTLSFEYVGFQKKAVSEVDVKAGEVATLETLLDEKSSDLTEVVVKATPRRMETVNALLVRQKNLPNISDGISAESIRRSPDKNTSEVLKRVSGATIQDNKFVVIRGLADRYNVATLNNSVLPSTEADRKVFAFDIIPANLIDNIQIFKTAAPDLPGDFSGGIVQVNTSDVPNKNQLSITLGVGINLISTGKNYEPGYLGKYDYLGFESGERRLPEQLPNLRGFTNVNDLVTESQKFNNLFGDRYNGKALPNQNYQISWAAKKDFKNSGTFGSVVSATYRNNQNIQYSERIDYADQGRTSPILLDYKDTIYKFTTTIGAMANFAYKKGNSKIAFKNLYNRLFDVTNIIREGINNDNIQYIKATSNETNIKTLMSSQLEGEHSLGKNRNKLTWNVNFAFTGGSQPDYHISPYAINQGDVDNKAVAYKVVLRDSYRFYSELSDISYGGTLNYAIPFKWRGENNLFKAGAYYLTKTRDYQARAFRYKAANQSKFNTNILSIEPTWVFDPSYMSPEGLALDEITNPSDQYKGNSQTAAGYVMMDNRLSSKFRVVWGLRVENFSYDVTTADFSNPLIEISRNYIDWLPSVNFTYSLTAKTNLRLSAFQSVSRPDFREVAPFQFYDFSRNAIIKGNANLERSQNTNLDLRFETYPSAGELFSFSLFAKYFDKPIEFVVQSGSVASNLVLTYANPNSALSYGAEFEFRKRLSFFENSFLKNVTAFGNLAYIFSSIDFENSGIDVYEEGRPMQGQSPYIINGGLQYGTEKGGMSFSALVNRVGHRIAFAGFQGYPDVYENGRTVVDFQIAKKVFKDQGEFRLNVSDLLNQKTIFYQNTNDITKRAYNVNDDRIWNSFSYGTNFSFTFSYNF